MLYKDLYSNAVATLISNEDLHEKGVAKNESYRMVSIFSF